MLLHHIFRFWTPKTLWHYVWHFDHICQDFHIVPALGPCIQGVVSKDWGPKWSTPRYLFIQVFVQLIYSKYIIVYVCLVVYLPLWKIWKSVGMIIPIYYGTNKFMFQTTNQDWCNVKILAGNWLDFPMKKTHYVPEFLLIQGVAIQRWQCFPPEKKTDLLRNPNVAKNQLQVRISLQKKSPIRKITILNNHGFQFTLPWSTSMMWTFYITYILYIEYTLWLFNIAMENDPFVDGLPGFTYQKWWFSQNQRVYIYIHTPIWYHVSLSQHCRIGGSPSLWPSPGDLT